MAHGFLKKGDMNQLHQTIETAWAKTPEKQKSRGTTRTSAQ